MTSRGTSMQDLKTKSAAAEKMKTMAIQRTVFGHECAARGGMFCSELSDIALGVACAVPNFYRKSASRARAPRNLRAALSLRYVATMKQTEVQLPDPLYEQVE